MTEFNIVLAGVGGQGTILAAEVIGTAAVKDGLNVRVGEIHGMAQRGGAVVSTVRIGEKVQAPTIMEGSADMFLGFEPLETIRNLRYASEKTTVVMSTDRILPTELAAKNAKYPSIEEVLAKIHCFTTNVIPVEAARLAEEAGSILTQNAVMLGALAAAAKLPIRKVSILEALRELVPPKHVDNNIKAFDLGFKTVRKLARKI